MTNLVSIGLISENYLLNLIFLIVGWFYFFNKSFSQSWLHGKCIVFQIYACHGLLILLFYDLLSCIIVAYMIQQPSHMDIDSQAWDPSYVRGVLYPTVIQDTTSFFQYSILLKT